MRHFSDRLDFLKAVEDLPIEQLVSQLAIEHSQYPFSQGETPLRVPHRFVFVASYVAIGSRCFLMSKNCRQFLSTRLVLPYFFALRRLLCRSRRAGALRVSTAAAVTVLWIASIDLTFGSGRQLTTRLRLVGMGNSMISGWWLSPGDERSFASQGRSTRPTRSSCYLGSLLENLHQCCC
jgi:hypothetical protein